MNKVRPTIKGIFVMSHVQALKRSKGSDAIRELVVRSGRRVRYRNSEDVPIRDEVIILEHVLDMLAKRPIPPGKREFEAGKLHFRNFSETPLGKLVLSISSFKTALLKAPWIARRVFRGVEFKSEDIGKKAVRITMHNNDYPLEHFQGFFKGWLIYARHRGRVMAKDLGNDMYVYTVRWK